MKNKSLSKTLAKETWLRYDEPSLRWKGNLRLSIEDTIIYTEEAMWNLVKAKRKFPLGEPELAAKKSPSNEFIEYILKVKTVFHQKGLVFVSNSLTKREVLRIFKQKLRGLL